MCRDYDQYAIKNMAQNKVGRLHIPYYTSDQNTQDCVKVRRKLQVGPKMFKTINQISPKSQAIKMHGIVFLEKMLVKLCIAVAQTSFPQVTVVHYDARCLNFATSPGAVKLLAINHCRPFSLSALWWIFLRWATMKMMNTITIIPRALYF